MKKPWYQARKNIWGACWDLVDWTIIAKVMLILIFFIKNFMNWMFLIEIEKSDGVQRYRYKLFGFIGPKIVSIGPLSAELWSIEILMNVRRDPWFEKAPIFDLRSFSKLGEGTKNEPYFTFTFLKSTVCFKIACLIRVSQNQPPSKLKIRARRKNKIFPKKI